MKKSGYHLAGIGLAGLVFLLTGCDQLLTLFQNQAGIVYGDNVSMANGIAQTWAELDRSGKPISVGVSISQSAIESINTVTEPTVYSLSFPDVAALPFDHIMLDWNPMGHEPPGTYDVPHFDFHFYLISVKQRQAITEDDPSCEMPPSTKYIPVDYQIIPGCVPQMGAHWIDPFSPEFQGQAFTSTLIYGSYDGQIIHIEPMVTLSFIESRPNFSASIKQPQEYAKSGYYPTRYSITYDNSTQEYRISVDDLVLR